MKRLGIDMKELEQTGLRFADRQDGWMPGRVLLSYSGRDHPLGTLPNPITEPIITFKKTGGEIGRLADELKIETHPPWLLRLHEDGIARQVMGNHIRTGERYLLATTGTVPLDVVAALELRQKESRTSEISLYGMDAPDVVSAKFTEALDKLQFGYALRARVDPVGLVPRWEASSGSSVWLPHEEVLLRMSAGFAATEFFVNVNGEERTRIPVHDCKDAIVSLGMLPIGRHVVEIGTIAANKRPVTPELILIDVRAPIPWQQGILAQAGFRVVLEPAHASIEELIAKRASLSIHGPAERVATVEARLFDPNGHITERCDLGKVPLPTSDLNRLIAKLSIEPLSEKIQSAPRVDLAFAVEELGTGSITFTRVVAPLRWKLEGHGLARQMRLVDEAGTAQDISIDRFDLTTPDRRVALEAKEALAGFPVMAPGAVFVARYASRRYAAIASVPARDRLTALSELGVTCALSISGASSRHIVRLLHLHRLWRGARALGPLAAIRKAKVLDIIDLQIARLACGHQWADRAHECREGKPKLLDGLQREVGGSPGFASRMRTTSWSWLADSSSACAEFRRLAGIYQISSDGELCDLALRLAFHASGIRLDDPKKGADEFEKLGSLPSLAKGAFLAKLVTDLNLREHEILNAGASP